MEAITLSIVVPIFNEENSLAHFLASAWSFEKTIEPRCCEFVFSLDGCSDQSLGVLQQTQYHLKHVHILVEHVNRGKGHAVRKGMIQGQGQYLAFVDADLSVGFSDVIDFVNRMESDLTVDIVAGDRWVNQRYDASTMRWLLSCVFRWWVRFVIGQKVLDSQCPLKVMRRQVFVEMAPYLRTNGFAFDVEWLAVAHTLGYRVEYQTVRSFINLGTSKVRALWHGPKMAITVICIKLRCLQLAVMKWCRGV